MVLEADRESGPAANPPAAVDPGRGGAPAVPPSALVSIVLVDESDREGPASALEAAEAQTWPDCEVIVAQPGAIRAAIDSTAGDYVAFAGTAKPLRPSAVHMGLAFPSHVQFFRALGDPRYREREAALPALDPR